MNNNIEQAKAIRSLGKRISFVSGNFNIIHPGHLRYLLFAKEQAEILVVGLYDETTSIGAYFSNQERLSALCALSFVDEVVVVQNDLKSFVNTLQPEIIVKGKEFEKEENIEQKLVEHYGGKLIFSSGEKQFSTKQLLQQQAHENCKFQQKLQTYHQRYNINSNILKQYIDHFDSLNIAIIGDIIVDEYQECLPIGMSQEDPSIAVSPLESFMYLGGAGIVAGHAKKLGANVKFYSVIGDDPIGEFARKKLSEYGVEAKLIVDKTRLTTHKKRYRARDKTLLRVNSFRKHSIERPFINELMHSLSADIEKIDVVIFADFNFGVLCPTIVNLISQLCARHSVPMAADSQSSSQIGDLSKFKDLLLTTPTEMEARLTTQDDDNGLIHVSRDLANRLRAQNVVVTLGAEGVLIRHRINDLDDLETDTLPALAESAIDTAGAGDAFFVTSTLMMSAGATIWQAAFVGSIASAIQVNTRGNIPISSEKVLKKLNEFIG